MKVFKYSLFISIFCSLLLSIDASAIAGVIPGDTFDITVVGFNSSNVGAYLVSPIDATFGVANATYAVAGPGGATVTISSSESIGPTITTDTFSIGVPVNFDPSGTSIDGSPITTMEADVGGYNFGTDTVNFNGAIDPSSLSVSGNIVYSGGTFALSPASQLGGGDTTLAMVEGVTAGGSSLDSFDINTFTFSVSYDNIVPVPEPGSLAPLGLGGLALLAGRRWLPLLRLI
jgi:hypothetical protein